MMPRWDYKCPICGVVKEVTPLTRDSIVLCTEEGHAPAEMDRLFPRTSFVVKGFSAANGYAGGNNG